MNEHDLLWAMLQGSLEEHFDVKKFEKSDNKFRITLEKKNIIPTDLPADYQGGKVINTA